jgi:acyl-CoA synthetase (AMP-forming)/AMP-acid ligase II
MKRESFCMNAASSPAGSNIVEILVHRAASHPQRPAYHFIGDDPGMDLKLDCATLLREAASLAVLLRQQTLHGKPVLLACKSNRFFVSAFHACLMAGAIVVPTAPPRRALLEERLTYISRHAGIAAVLSDADSVLRHEFAQGLAIIDLRAQSHWPKAQDWEPPEIHSATPACILYTSGTLSEPHGVLLDHGNLMDASRGVAQSFGHTSESVCMVTLPLFHDMGLLMGVIHPVICDVPVHLMTPAQFVQKPLRWLKLLQRLRITTAGGPNFMFDIVVRNLREEQLTGINLSRIRTMFCTGEPIRVSTVSRLLALLAPCGMNTDAFLPAYSTTETLGLVTGSVMDRPAATDLPGFAGVPHPLICCGRAQTHRDVIIVDPVSRQPLPEGGRGEIWISGSCIGRGYWKEPLLTEAIFAATLADGHGPYLRTGDTGYLKDRKLYFLGRLTDRIRLHGCDHYPQDLEYQAERSHPGIRPSSCAAFTVDARHRPRLVIACELKKEMLRRRESWPQIESSIKAAIRRVHGLHVDEIAFLVPGTLSKTSSGKVRRHQCRDDFLKGSLILAEALPLPPREAESPRDANLT